MKRFPAKLVFPLSVVPVVLYLTVVLVVGCCGMSAEYVLAGDSIPRPFQHNRAQASTLWLPSEEIQDLVISSQLQPTSVKSLEEYHNPVFADVYFDEQRRFIDTPLKIVLFQVARLLGEERQWSVQIEGYCDPRGPSAYNFARANLHLAGLAVYLQQLGIPRHQISAMNVGQDPVPCLDKSERCQEDNLRAENIFPILSLGNTQRGCLVRLRLIPTGNESGTGQISKDLPSLQRIQVASPSPT